MEGLCLYKCIWVNNEYLIAIVLISGYFFLLIFRYGISHHKFWENLGIEGPVPEPFFGHTRKIYDPKIGFNICIKEWTKKYGNYFGIYFFHTPILVVRDQEMLKQIFVKQFNNFIDRWFHANGLLNNGIVQEGVFFKEGADWNRIRRIMSPTFSSGKLKELSHHINRTSHDLVENFGKNSGIRDGIDAKHFFGAFSLDVIAGLAFGLKINSQNNPDISFIKNTKALLTFKTLTKLKVLLSGLIPLTRPIFQYFDLGFFDSQTCNYFENYIDAMLHKRKDQPLNEKSMDFLQLLLNAEADEHCGFMERKLSLREIAGQCMIFIIAGYETTSSTLQYIAYELANNRLVQENVRLEIEQYIGNTENPTYEQIQDLKYTSAVISEVLRMYPPLHLLSRKAKNDCTVSGVPIAAGTGIFIPLYSIGRDPEVFEDPNVFKPERFLGENNQSTSYISFLPFGFGPRHCIGMRLARLQVTLALVHILRKCAIQHASPEVIEFEDFSGLLMPKQPIRLTVENLENGSI